MKRLFAGLAGLLSLALIVGMLTALPLHAALAQTAPAPSTVVDLHPILNYVWEVLGTVAGVAALFVLKKASAWFTAKTGVNVEAYNAQIRQLIDEGLAKAIAYGKSKTENLAEVDAKNVLIKTAADYAMAHFPDALDHFGITPEQLKQKLEARLKLDQGGSAILVAPAAQPTVG